MSEPKMYIKWTFDNIPKLRNGWKQLMAIIRSNKIVTKPADKGSIVVVMAPQFFWKMCQSYLNNNDIINTSTILH